MHLHDLLGGVDVLELTGDAHVDVQTIEHDSRRAREGALFCAIRGARTDGHDHAPEAVRRGAVALLVERIVALPVPQVRVAEVRRVLGPLASRLAGNPSEAMCVLGVTGTNGKTTVTYLLEAIGRAAGQTTGVLGTTGARIGADHLDLAFTTPEAPELQALLARMRDHGVTQVAMEVSSHALDMHRVDGTRFAAACFTNLSQDHLDLHETMEGYLEAKSRLFDPELSPAAAISLDDPAGERLAQLARARGLSVTRFGLDPRADVRAEALEREASGTRFRLVVPGTVAEVRLPLLGRFNVANALGAAATALAVGAPFDAVVAGLEQVGQVPGRMEPVRAGQPFTVLVDYAHTPDALARVLDEARRLAAGHRVLVVFGCGGDRDPEKRLLMGRAAAAADVVVLTSDNPRSEDPATIARAVAEGLRAVSAEHSVVLDRREAIRAALAEARAGEVVVIAGKGDETGQTAAGHTRPFDDRVVVEEELEALAWT